MKKILKYTGVPTIAIIIFVSAMPAFAGSTVLRWLSPQMNTDNSTLTDLAGYKVYMSSASGSYTAPHTTLALNSSLLSCGPKIVNGENRTECSSTIGNLSAGTYYFVMTAYDTAGNESSRSNEISRVILPDVDTTAPVISGVYSGSITTSGATIYWTTNEAADTQVRYGTTTAYGSTTTLNTTMATSHSQSISGLSPSTLYHYSVRSRDAAGNLASSSDYTFTTSAAPDTTAPAISNVQVSNITASSARITWTTNEASTSRVEYGTTTAYGSQTVLNSSMVTTHTVTVTGLSGFTSYEFRVRSRDAAGNEAVSGNSSFKTSNTTPTISAFQASPTSGDTPLYVSFSATAADPDGTILHYEWDFDGDGIYDNDTGTVAGAAHTYTAAGSYNVRVRATDNGGAATVSGAVTVTVNSPANKAPVVSSLTGSPSTGDAPLDVTFSVSATDPDGSIAQYEWDFDGNGIYDATTTSSPVSHTFDVEGIYLSKVRVTDNQGATAAAETTITVTTVAPAPSSTPDNTGNTAPDNGSGGSGSTEKVTVSGGGAGCFIATAAFGSYLDSHVMILRVFRDNYLLTNKPGRYFVAFYYRVSPPIADIIARHEILRIISRAILTPVIYSVEYPIAASIILFIAAASALYYRKTRMAVKKALT